MVERSVTVRLDQADVHEALKAEAIRQLAPEDAWAKDADEEDVKILFTGALEQNGARVRFAKGE